ncbi:glutamate racemase [Candidatus Nomurabacteria bacterium]|nr:glutamate racemase [Candidatus Nomurabacteria bacterium]
MRIGIFDSGLGGLIIARAIVKKMPEYDYVYLGDTKRVPYGNRSHETVFEFTKEAVDYLFKKENCAIVIVACNTASARALRKIQQEYLPKIFPKDKFQRKVLGVLIPAAEECVKYKKVGVLATQGTVASDTFPMEINKLNSKIKVIQNSAPMLVPLAEEGEAKLALPFIQKYLKPILDKNTEAIVLGCTHYPIFKKQIKLTLRSLGVEGKIISQDEIVPKKLKDYFLRHPEVAKNLSRKHTTKILVTDMTKNIQKLSEKWFGKNIKPKLIILNS